MILGDCVLATETERCQCECLIFPNCEAVMWRQAESGGSLMDLRWQHLRHWSEKKERKSETVTATDPRGEREEVRKETGAEKRGEDR